MKVQRCHLSLIPIQYSAASPATPAIVACCTGCTAAADARRRPCASAAVLIGTPGGAVRNTATSLTGCVAWTGSSARYPSSALPVRAARYDRTSMRDECSRDPAPHYSKLPCAGGILCDCQVTAGLQQGGHNVKACSCTAHVVMYADCQNGTQVVTYDDGEQGARLQGLLGSYQWNMIYCELVCRCMIISSFTQRCKR